MQYFCQAAAWTAPAFSFSGKTCPRPSAGSRHAPGAAAAAPQSRRDTVQSPLMSPWGLVPAVPAPTGKEPRSNRGQVVVRTPGHESGHTSGHNTRTFQVCPPSRERARIYWLSGGLEAKHQCGELGQLPKVGPTELASSGADRPPEDRRARCRRPGRNRQATRRGR